MNIIHSIAKNKTNYLGGLLFAMSSLMVPTAAVNAETIGIHFGADVGRAEARKFCDNISRCDSSDNTAKVHVGFQFTPYIGVEAGYVSFGTIFKSNDVAARASQKASAITASAVGTLNFGEMFGIFGRAGAAQYDTKGSGMVAGVRVKDRDGVTPFFGAGARINLTENIGLRAEYQVYTDISNIDGKKDDVQALYAGAVFTF